MNSFGGVIGLPITNHFSPITSHGRASGLAPLNPNIDGGPIFGPMFKGGVEKSNQLPELYEAVAKMGGAGFLNAGSGLTAVTVGFVRASQAAIENARNFHRILNRLNVEIPIVHATPSLVLRERLCQLLVG